MNFTGAISHCLSNYASFSGRASRSEYWYFVLFSILLNFVVSFVVGMVSDMAGILANLLIAFGLLLPSLAVGVRRLHDIGRSGWWLLIGLVPLVGPILLLVWACTRGEPQPNRFGANPLASSFFAGTQPA